MSTALQAREPKSPNIGLEANRRELSDRLTRGADHAPPGARVDIPKPEGRQRPLGIPTLEDKIVPRATVEVLNAIDAGDALGFSDGFQLGRSPPDALEAATVGIEQRNVNWVLEADMRGCLEAIDHAWLVTCMAHRSGDQRVVRHGQTWLKAGVLEDGPWRAPEAGRPQGGNVSPLAAHLARHDVLEVGAERWRRRYARGEVISVRYGDDVIVGFAHRDDAERFWAELRERVRTFNLARPPEKTRLSEFGHVAAERRQRRGQGTPETFDVRGLTPICSQTRTGKCTVRRKTIATRRRQKRQAVKQPLHARMPWPIRQLGAWLKSVLTGPYRYDGVPRHLGMLRVFRDRILRAWCPTRRRRSQRPRTSWPRRYRLATRGLPAPHLLHPSPAQRLRVMTRGRRPGRSCRTPGAGRGVPGHRHPSRDPFAQ
ncbi:MAG: reverse transcriptase domain-containing protein [Candidatus Entotheonellia bacterium]